MKIDDASLLAYVDGELSGEACAQVEKAIGASAEIASRVSMLLASHGLPYRQAFEQQSLPPVPESLNRNVDEMIRRYLAGSAARRTEDAAATGHAEASLGENVHRLKPRTRSLPQWSWPKLGLAFAAGACCYGIALHLVLPLTGHRATLVTASNDPSMAPWIEAAAGYQQLYTRDTIALLQPDSRMTDTTVADIRQADNLPLRIPDLRSQGLTFKRVQRLSFHGRPLVQIVYLPEKGKPVALCVLKEARADAAPSNGNVDGMAWVAWRRGQLGYALIAEPGHVDLDALGRQLYEDQSATTISRYDAGDAHRT